VALGVLLEVALEPPGVEQEGIGEVAVRAAVAVHEATVGDQEREAGTRDRAASMDDEQVG
jgi:hypothetical protein